MKNITIIIERSNDFYWAYAENVEGISAGGEIVQEAKNGIFEAIALQKELGNFPYNNYQLTYKYDTESLLQYFKGIISNPAFERLTGINQKLIHQYAVGLKKLVQLNVKKYKKDCINSVQNCLVYNYRKRAKR
ncbi:type II toxin-antitoxin system HicB family antitoxin [Capnocytophaga sputigena]|uniref:type II toxin-antitoxin system HicB family antitoxin n=1 Tax=Capnocytophaga sputigena TaxID=1019 RepID=UPI0028E771B4|nr:type II toxin-antitoxin system HicB family antitoxin [Capnocytophaga sputigena]